MLLESVFKFEVPDNWQVLTWMQMSLSLIEDSFEMVDISASTQSGQSSPPRNLNLIPKKFILNNQSGNR